MNHLRDWWFNFAEDGFWAWNDRRLPEIGRALNEALDQLEQAEKERDETEAKFRECFVLLTEARAKHDEARIAAMGLAEKLGKCNVQRDRLTAALVGSVAVLKHYDFPGYPPEVLQAINRLSAARDALASQDVHPDIASGESRSLAEVEAELEASQDQDVNAASQTREDVTPDKEKELSVSQPQSSAPSHSSSPPR